MGTSEFIDSSAAFRFEVPGYKVRRLYRRNFKSAALAAASQSECRILNSTRFHIW
jgi:hypothetical protein